jgi:hypothetical protein
MKKRAVSALVLIIAGVIFMAGMTGCDNGTNGTTDTITKFEGTWKTQDDADDYWIYTFTGKNITGKHDGDDDAEKFEWTGTFTFTETHITFNPASSNPSTPLSSWTQKYEILAEPARLKLVKPEGSGDIIGGEFLKQP